MENKQGIVSSNMMMKILLSFVIVFVVVWMVPLFFPPNIMIRWAFEEFRVLAVGMVVGAGIVYIYEKSRGQVPLPFILFGF